MKVGDEWSSLTGQRPGRAARVTAADVARQAGVSTAAVSYALNGQPGVSEESRRRVLAAAAELGFRPNRLARGLRKGRTRVLGLLLADIANPYYPEIASGVIDEATRRGYEVFLSHTGLHQELQAREVGALCDHQCDGLIFTSVIESDRPLLEGLLQDRMPFVQVVRRLENLRADFVGIGDQAAGREVGEHVVEMGCRRPVILNGPAESSASRARLAGYREGLSVHSVSPLQPDLVDGELTRDSGYKRAAAALDTGGELPDGLICGNDMIALGAIDAVLERELRIPVDVAVVGYDDMFFASSPLVQLSTVQAPRQQLGSTAVRILLDRIEHAAAEPRTVILPHRFVARRTTGASVSSLSQEQQATAAELKEIQA